METTETKLKIESEVNALKREYKSLHAQVAALKNDYTTLVEMNEKQKEFKDEQDAYLKEVLNDIAHAKVEWMHEKEAEYVKIAKEREEIADIVSRKSDLDKQEKKVTDIFDSNTKILNENKALKLELEATVTDIENQRKTIKAERSEVAKLEKALDNKVQEFKDRVQRIIKELN